MNPPVITKPDWASTIGLFIINFGMLDYLVLDWLEARLPAEQFKKSKTQYLQNRIGIVKDLVEKSDFSAEKRERFEKFFHDLDPIRELRNRIAHGQLLVRWLGDPQVPVVTLSRPKDLDAYYAPESQHLALDELQEALAGLSELIEEFQQLTGCVVVDPNRIQTNSP